MGKAGWDDEYDAVVAGSGAGAMAGALTAASNGLRTAVLEKTALLGGTSAYSGSAIWLPGTQVQERAGIGDSSEGARTYLRALLGDGSAAHREAFLATAPELVEFLEKDPAIEFEWRPFPDYFAAPGRLDLGRSFVPLDLPAERLGELAGLVRPPVDRDRAGRGHSASKPMMQGRALIGRLLLAITATGNGAVRTETPLTDLIVEDGRVAGVEAGGLRLRAKRGVLLAAGGFESSAALRSERGVPGGAAWTMAPAGANTGDAIAAAVRAGASTGLLDQAWFCPGSLMPDGRAAFTLGFRGGLIVDGSGRRFANESLPYDQMGRRMAAAEGPFHLIFDARSRGLPAISVPPLMPDEQLASGAWVEAATLPELAARIGLPGDVLAGTVARFNGFAGKGTDEDFHRGEDPYDLYFTGGEPAVVAVDEPPYVAAKIVLSDLGTKGGLRTDPDGRVLDGADRPIAGLYAAGNTSASFTGPVYPGPGIPIGSAMAFAYRAVQDMRRNHP
ncbi:FAD-binding protein [Actinomadura darangshiensis]|uniref:3-oxosteroid 1-dehydrogenase n=1 Tax=Actinomadura darangshiensis TaxID=705336 RepID=A0A4R5BZB3_9ACTN|nr:FAD-dependent oxidoreductase [Actinomadura darangshiensis]TDD91083.1 FAD-binding protein [Actinomadura darangshiensis]